MRGALPVLLTVDEAADLLRTTRRAIYAMIERRQLPGVIRVRRRVLLRADDLLDWLEQKCAPSRGGTGDERDNPSVSQRRLGDRYPGRHSRRHATARGSASDLRWRLDRTPCAGPRAGNA